MKENYLYWIWLSELKGIGPVIAKRLIERFNSPENIYIALKEELKTIEGVGDSIANNIIENKNLDKAKEILNICKKKDIKITTYKDKKFPCNINSYPNMPILLYYRGRLYENLSGVAIVGSRRCSDYAKQVTVEAATYLAENKIPVISGMAKGIDSYAHTSCIKAKGYTIAFLGCGVDICYPKEHAELMEKIIETSAVISEYPPGAMPNKHSFPKRNRLISACCEKILIAEASENSGALITAKYAKEQNKEVFAVPNNIYSKESKGTNNLIAEGAKVYLSPKQLFINNSNIKEFKNILKSRSTKLIYSNEEQKILNILGNKPSTIDEISIIFKKERSMILDILLSMELEGKIKCQAGRYL
ncbi:DNA-processing protein DprA [Clostridium sp.]|uniref:DNA-processing protein DprA n=1 Tax=Clostridium sp. TaxID=1506 RepID=UPI0026344888|nr:DNA-processing protein DprA [Clostridium sp.]